MTKATGSIKSAIAKQFDAAVAKGDLDAAEKWQIALEKFVKTGALPSEKETKTAVGAAASDYKKASAELAAAYEAVVKSLTMQKKIAEAKAARDELRGFGGGLPSPRTPQQPQAPEWQDITSDLLGGMRRGKVIATRGKDKVVSTKAYSPPIEIEYVCGTNRDNIRIGFACDQLIFNWELDRNQLRIDGGPADGKHVMNAGAVPSGQMVTIRQVVTPTEMAVFVGGEKRASWAQDFSRVVELIELFSGRDSELVITSVRIRQGHR